MTEEWGAQEEPENGSYEGASSDEGSAGKPGIIRPTHEEIAELGGREDLEATAEDQAEDAQLDVAALLEKAKQADEYFERLQRLQAEFDNYRKRVTRERGELKQWAVWTLVEELVEVMDVFERALHEDHAAEVPAPYREGIEMVHRKLADTLARYGLSRLESVGERFDPHFHEALTQETSEDYESGVIIDEVKPGYLLGERLLRPSLVRVSAGPGTARGNADGRAPADAESDGIEG